MGDRFAGRMSDASYFGNYERLPVAWRLRVGEVDGEPAVVVLNRTPDGAEYETAIRIEVAGGRIVRVVDYVHCPWVLPAATSVSVDRALPN